MKKVNVKRTIMVMMVAMLTATTAFAQTPQRNEMRKRMMENQERVHRNGQHPQKMQRKGQHLERVLDLTEDQKEQIKDFRIAHQKESLPIKNTIGEKEARLKTLTTSENFNERAINSVIEEIGDLRTEMMKLRVAHVQDIKSILDEEQLAKFNAMQANRPKRQNFRRGRG